MELPSLHGRIEKFVSDVAYKRTHIQRYVPKKGEEEFWDVLYAILAKSDLFSQPVPNVHKKINPYFGFFGNRWNPSTRQPGNFHTGIDIEGRRKTVVHPITNGILEYSGYGATSGMYVMLSHPRITTEDGFVLHSLYMHLREAKVKFSSYQKMLREISLHTHPRVSVSDDTVIGLIGDSGQSKYPDGYVHMHMQLEFRNKEGHIIFIDPARLLGLEKYGNETADITTEKAFMDIYVRNRKDVYKRKLEEVWKKK